MFFIDDSSTLTVVNRTVAEPNGSRQRRIAKSSGAIRRRFAVSTDARPTMRVFSPASPSAAMSGTGAVQSRNGSRNWTMKEIAAVQRVSESSTGKKRRKPGATGPSPAHAARSGLPRINAALVKSTMWNGLIVRSIPCSMP